MAVKDIEIPALMKGLKRDHRGYPIPAGVLIDADGKAHFTINDEVKRQTAIKKGLCAICGHKLMKMRWFVGGPLSAFHAFGSYIDPPMHEQCAKYALRVCPYLAAPRYVRRIDDRMVSAAKIPGIQMVKDPTMIPERPELFVLIMTGNQQHIMNGAMVQYLKPERPYRKVEYWMCGEQLDYTEGYRLAMLAFEEEGEDASS